MDFTYYTWFETVILYTTQDGDPTLTTYVEKGMEEAHTVCLYGVDLDFTVPCSVADQIENDIRQYGRKMMYADTFWLCTHYGKTRILELCAAQQIPITSVVKVYKRKNGSGSPMLT